MSTVYEAHLVVGCYVSDIMKGYPEDAEEMDVICELQEEGVYEWYEDEGLLGIKVTSSEGCGYTRVSCLSKDCSKMMDRVQEDLKADPVIQVCVYTY